MMSTLMRHVPSPRLPGVIFTYPSASRCWPTDSQVLRTGQTISTLINNKRLCCAVSSIVRDFYDICNLFTSVIRMQLCSKCYERLKMKVKQQRDFVMSVKLTPDMREKLMFVSNAIGQAPATVASFSIGQCISEHYARLTLGSNAIDKTIAMFGPEFREALKKLSETESEEPCLSSKECLEPPQPSVAEKTKKPTKSSRFGTSSKSKHSTGEDLSK